MKPEKDFDCVEMKRKAQEKIYEETKDLSREELVAYFHRRAETGPFGKLWKKAKARQPRPKTPRHRTKP